MNDFTFQISLDSGLHVSGPCGVDALRTVCLVDPFPPLVTSQAPEELREGQVRLPLRLLNRCLAGVMTWQWLGLGHPWEVEARKKTKGRR